MEDFIFKSFFEFDIIILYFIDLNIDLCYYNIKHL